MDTVQVRMCATVPCDCDKKAFEECTCYEDYLMQLAKMQIVCSENKRVDGPKEPLRPLGHYPIA